MLRWKSTSKTKARLCVLSFQDPDFTEVHPDSTTLSAEALILHVGEVEVGVERHQDGICVKRRVRTATSSSQLQMMCEIYPQVQPRLQCMRHSAKLCMVSGTPEEMVESCERITSESWIHNLCVGSVCAFVPIKQNKGRGVTGVHVDDLLGGGDEKCLTRAFWKSSVSSTLVLGMSDP